MQNVRRLDNRDMDMRVMYAHKLIKRFSLKITEGYSFRQAPDEGWGHNGRKFAS